MLRNPFENINSSIHRHDAGIILRLKANGINVFEFVKKEPGSLNHAYKDIEACDVKTANEILKSKYVKVLILNKEDRVIARNWI